MSLRAIARPLFAVLMLMLMPVATMAQGTSPPPAASGSQTLKPEELEALVAPVALEPTPPLVDCASAKVLVSASAVASPNVANRMDYSFFE